MKKNFENQRKNKKNAVKGERARHRGPARFGIQLNLWNILAAVGLLAAATAFFVLTPSLLWEEEPTGRYPIYGWYTAAYWGLVLLGEAACLCRVDLPEKARYGVGWGLVLLMPLGAFFAVDLINSTRILTFSFPKGFANYLCYFMLFAFFYALFRRAWAAALAGGMVSLGFGVINYFVVQFRGEPILPWDLQSVSTAAEVAGGYKFDVTQPMALSALGFFCLTALCVKLGPRGKGKTTKTFRLTERLCALGMSLILFLLIFPANLLSSLGISVWAWNQKTSSEITGVLAGFFANIQFLMVDKPETYSEERVKELAAQVEALEEPEPLGSPSSLPTIVVVMNESMTDLQKVGDVEFQPDNLPFLHSLEESGSVIWGTAYSSVYGGNTCNSEYEFLTGNTTAFLPSGSKPYQQYVDRQQTALPSILKSYGYTCTAIHPGNRKAWQRDTAYPYLGFDEFIDVKAFNVHRRMERKLTSDLSGYEQVIWEYEHRKEGEPLFLFHVTIQNHGGFEEEDYPAVIKVKGAEGEYPQTEQYLSLTKKSDEALEYLLDYFSRRPDPVVLLFFGDHWPNLEQDFLTQLLGTDAGSLEFQDLMREYQVPFMIWANYPLEGQKIEQVSVNYLSGLLLRAAGLKGTGYTKFLENLRQQAPVVTAVGCIGQDGALYKNGAETPFSQQLEDYAVLQYNNAFGAQEKAEYLFTP